MYLFRNIESILITNRYYRKKIRHGNSFALSGSCKVWLQYVRNWIQTNFSVSCLQGLEECESFHRISWVMLCNFIHQIFCTRLTSVLAFLGLLFEMRHCVHDEYYASRNVWNNCMTRNRVGNINYNAAARIGKNWH